MENNKEYLQKAINAIHRQAAREGRNTTEEEMAQNVGLSKEQLHVFLNGEEEIPEGLASNLLSFYGIKFRLIEVRQVHDVYEEEEKEDSKE